LILTSKLTGFLDLISLLYYGSFMAQDKNADINAFLSNMQAAFKAAAEMDTGAAKDCFRQMSRTVSAAFDQARDMAGRGERAAAITFAGAAMSAALDKADKTIPSENFPGRQAYHTLAFRKLSESTRLGVSVAEKLKQRVDETMRLIVGKPATPIGKLCPPPPSVPVFPTLFSGRKLEPYKC
jgi:hypothetical protein